MIRTLKTLWLLTMFSLALAGCQEAQCPEGTIEAAQECLPLNNACGEAGNPCGSGPSVGVGACVFGETECDVFESMCVGEVLATAEVCDGVDNDCDGETDENIAGCCTNGATRDCGTDEGQCTFGTQTCAGMEWGNCLGGAPPVAESCNGVDNDCDGIVDDVPAPGCTPGTSRSCGITFGLREVCRSNCTWGPCESIIIINPPFDPPLLP